jgi:hypothetical protein
MPNFKCRQIIDNCVEMLEYLTHGILLMNGRLLRLMLAIIASFICPLAIAKDGLVAQLTFNKSAEGSNRTQSYQNAVLVNFNDTHTFDFHSFYSVKITTRTEDFEHINLVLTFKDLSSGKPFYIGAKELDIVVGGSKNLSFQLDNTNYKVNIDTSYRKLP